MNDDSIKLKIDPNVWKCISCGEKHSIEDWDRSTLTRCNNRNAKRKYKSLKIESCRQQGSKRIYLCPSCGEMVQGFNITTCFD